jgi:diaminopimelate epimerase
MIEIPFVKAHGAKNDFLLTWRSEAPGDELLREAAIAICDRHTGAGADGWLLVEAAQPPEPARIRLFNPDGGEVEMSGNGTRCAAAFLLDAGKSDPEMVIRTGGGDKLLRLESRDELRFVFQMNMGAPRIEEGHLRFQLLLGGGMRECTIVWVGNPQCAVFVDDFEFDWRGLGAEIERHPQFPNRTNVSFVRVLDEHRLDVRFFERGAGFTMSSGTGSTGAVASALARGLVSSPVTAGTLAGPLEFRASGEELHMVGPAEFTARGVFWMRP